MSTEEIALQEHLLSKAKNDLLEEGEVVPVTFIVARKMGIPPEIRALLRKLANLDRMNDDEAASNPTDKICLIVPNRLDPSSLIDILPFALRDAVFEGGEKFDPTLIDVIRASAVTFFQTNEKSIIDARVWSALRNILDMSEKDVLSSYLRYLCKVTEAEAILKVDEAYFQMKQVPAGQDPKDVDVPKDLSKDPSSQEGIMCSLETATLHKMVILKFKRDAQNKPVDFERVEMGNDKGDLAFSGRFMNMIKTETTSESSA